jgi:hypothetical protein
MKTVVIRASWVSGSAAVSVSLMFESLTRRPVLAGIKTQSGFWRSVNRRRKKAPGGLFGTEEGFHSFGLFC